MTGSPYVFDIVEPHKSKQGSITMVRKKDWAFTWVEQKKRYKMCRHRFLKLLKSNITIDATKACTIKMAYTLGTHVLLYEVK